MGWSHPPPPLRSSHTSRVPYCGNPEMRPKHASSVAPVLSVLTPHGPVWPPAPVIKQVSGFDRFCDAPLLNSKTLVRATGIFDRSGFGIRTLGTLLLSGSFGFRTTRNSRNLPTQGSLDLPASASAMDRSAEGFLPSWCSHRFTNQHLSPTFKPLLVKSMTMSYLSAMPCSSSWVSTTGLGNRLPSLAIWVIGTALPLTSTQQILKNRETLALRMRKRYFRCSTSKYGL